MTLGPGSQLGAFSIVELIGAGGMGEVYRARDTRLSRDVAIKILPTGVMEDRDRRARFEREAQVLASLNHAGIATIHGVEEWGAGVALVMELVEGPTLAERIQAGPIAIDEARTIARQICEALEYAHERGIIHRDLKPANIKVRPDGAVKLLDFGLAKALEPDEAPGARAGNATHSPTLSLAGTRAGVILGTAGYMAPEQARGGPADRRADIWAFGCVLFEMLSGKQPFNGDTVSDMLAAVLRADPEWTRIPAGTPPNICRLLRRCLEKEPRRRLQHIGDARLELDALEPEPSTAEAGTIGRRRRVVLFAAGIAAGATAVGALWALLPTSPAAKVVTRFRVPLPVHLGSAGQSVAMSPDGRTIIAEAGPAVNIIGRQLDSLTFETIRGTEGGVAPFFSPDSAWIAFVAEGKLKRVPTRGGLPVTICDISARAAGASWGDDGFILLAAGDKLLRVAATGGELQPFIDGGGSDGAFADPIVLPGSRAAVVRAGLPGNGRIVAIDLRTHARHPLLDGNSPKLASTGDLLFEQGGAIWAVGFDSRRLAILGAPVRVVDSVRVIGRHALFSPSRDGSLGYVARDSETEAALVWLTRNGVAINAVEAKADYQAPRLSPDGKRVVVSIQSPSGVDLWLCELERGTRLRLTNGAINRRGLWSPDGQRVAFYSSGRDGDQDLFLMSSAGSAITPMLSRPGGQYPDSWSADGRFLIFNEGGGRRNLWVLPLNEPPRALHTRNQFNERGAVFSPDGRWVAYVTDESGRDEVYVEAFPGPGAKVAVSTQGGIQPMWSRDGRELFYREGDWLMSAAVEQEPFRIAVAKRLFEMKAEAFSFDPNFADYDTSPDGRFLAVKRDRAATDEVHVVLNWSEELRRALKR